MRRGCAHGAAFLAQSTIQQDDLAPGVEESRPGLCAHAGARRPAACEGRFDQHGLAKCLLPRLCRLYADARVCAEPRDIDPPGETGPHRPDVRRSGAVALSSLAHRRCLAGAGDSHRGHHECHSPAGTFTYGFRQSPGPHDHLPGRNFGAHAKEVAGQLLPAQSGAKAASKETKAMKTNTLTLEQLHQVDGYWRAANYLSVGQIYLHDNPLLKRPLTLADVKHMLLGHWGTTPGQNFIYAHLNRVIKKYDLDMIYVSGPGHGGPAVVGNTYLEGTYSEVYPNVSQDEAGLRKLFIQFSFPGGIPSHASPETPGSIHEGGELGYSLSHSFGAAFDNPDLIVACVVGDGEAETGPLATAWHSNKFLDPATDGAVLPILHLNGYKISNPTVLARITREELEQLFCGYGWTPLFVEYQDNNEAMHEAMAAALDAAVEMIKQIRHAARAFGNRTRPRWPMIVLDSPKGWTGPKWVDGKQIEGTFRAHQVPLSDPRSHPEHLKQLEEWLKSYRPEELFNEQGRLKLEIAELAPKGARRMGANPHANGGILLA